MLWYHVKWWRKSLCRSFEWEKMASRKIFGLFLSCELFSVSSKAGLKSQTRQENTTKMKIWKITTVKFKCKREHILGHDWLTKITWIKRARGEFRVCKVQNIRPANFFMFILLTSNHTVFLVQFGINLHLWVFQKAKLHSPKRLVQFQLSEKLTRAN